MHLAAILGHSPGPVCNAVRGLIQSGQPLAKISLLQNATSKALKEPLMRQLELDAPGVNVVFYEIPSLDESHEDMIKCFKKLKLDATHILTDTAAALLLCSLLCHLPRDVTPVHTRWNGGDALLDLLVGNNSPYSFNGIGGDEAISLHGLTLIEGYNLRTIENKQGGQINRREIPIVTFRNETEDGQIFEASRVEVDSRGCLCIIFDAPKRQDYFAIRAAWTAFILDQGGKWNRHLGDHAGTLKVCGANPSLASRLKSMQWRVS